MEGQKAARSIHAGLALLPQGWEHNVRITIADGRIAKTVTDAEAAPGDERHGIILPAVHNLHSHAFQRAMAGLAETRGPANDSFWSWRTLMYDFALKMTPDDIEAVAAQLYVEMLEAGFSRVGEFHYLHNDNSGQPYGNIAETAMRIAAASTDAGIGLTLLPVFYAHSAFGGAAPHEGQRRFTTTISTFEKLVSASAKVLASVPGANLGIAPHSLRAVTPSELAAVAALAGDGPIHMHVAEQTQEVDDCISWLGARPVGWLLDNMAVDKHWCLIHATHMTVDETLRLAKSGAVAGLCPITEANLGDGIFPAAAFIQAGGAFGVGSDSNVLISLTGELRQLEYSQRLHLRARNVLAQPDGSNGRYLLEHAVAGGGAALGVAAGLATGNFADMISLDTSTMPLLERDRILDHWIFAEGYKIDCVWAMGQKQVEDGRHVRREPINRCFLATMKKLLSP